MTERPARDDVNSSRRRVNWTTLALLGALALLLLIVAYLATNRNSDQDKLTGNEVATSAPSNVEKLCAANGTYELIKRDLFRRAAQLRGSDQAAYDQIASAAAVRMENPVMESEDSATHAANCSGSLSIDLPPGAAVTGGRTTLMSDVDYTVQQAADSSGTVVSVHNADAVIQALATLERVQQPPPVTSPEVANEAEQENSAGPVSPEPAVPVSPPAAPPASAPVAAARPSFNCVTARTTGERAVCSDPGLARMDRAMAAEYGRALAVSTPDQRDQLRQSAYRFYAYRDRCADRQCIAEAYAGRIREIRDIVEGRWQPR